MSIEMPPRLLDKNVRAGWAAILRKIRLTTRSMTDSMDRAKENGVEVNFDVVLFTPNLPT